MKPWAAENQGASRTHKALWCRGCFTKRRHWRRLAGRSVVYKCARCGHERRL